ncbi:MAG TPA: hypothetical protein VGP15_10855, partial [Burkholderiales bacterium]|nr:hypothetical protein [Burkholderiales bacterium]
MKPPSLPSRYALLAGFGLLLTLLVGVSVLGATRAVQSNRELQSIISEQDVKAGLVSTIFRL